MIAAELAIIAPDQVRRLVLVDAFGLWLDDEPSQDPFGAAQAVPGGQVVRSGGHSRTRSRPTSCPTPTIPYGATRVPGPEPTPRPPSSCGRSPNEACAAACRTWTCPPSSSTAPPTAWSPSATPGRWPTWSADARLELIEGAAHYPMFEQEDAFVEAVEGFLAD